MNDRQNSAEKRDQVGIAYLDEKCDRSDRRAHQISEEDKRQSALEEEKSMLVKFLFSRDVAYPPS